MLELGCPAWKIQREARFSFSPHPWLCCFSEDSALFRAGEKEWAHGGDFREYNDLLAVSAISHPLSFFISISAGIFPNFFPMLLNLRRRFRGRVQRHQQRSSASVAGWSYPLDEPDQAIEGASYNWSARNQAIWSGPVSLLVCRVSISGSGSTR